jgi:hypothetical protein
MFLRDLEYGAAASGIVLAIILLLIVLRFRRDILAAERKKAAQKVRVYSAKNSSPIGMKEPESDQDLVGAADHRF